MEETIYVIKAHRDRDFTLTGDAFRSSDEADDKIHELTCEAMLELASDDELDAVLGHYEGYEGIPEDRADLLPTLIKHGDIDVDGWASTVNECGQLYSWEEVVVRGEKGRRDLHERTETSAKSAKESRERIFVARGGHAWGKGFTTQQAVEAALGAGGNSYSAKKARKKLSVYKLPHGAYGVGVDEMGTIHWTVMWGGEGGTAEEIPEEEWM